MNEKIMVVDDDQEIVEFIVTGLETHGYNVIAAYNGAEAIKLAHLKKPDLILLDYNLPGADGFSVHRGLKKSKITKDIPVIYVTAHTRSQVIDKVVKLKAAGFIVKPFKIEKLIKRIRKALVEEKET